MRPRLAPRAAALALVPALAALAPGAAAAAACAPTDRALTLVNHCSQTLWLAASGDTGAACLGNADCTVDQFCTPIVSNTTTACTTTADCPTNYTCNGTVCTFHNCTFVPLGGTSTAGTTPCAANSACAADQYCSTSTGTCATVPSGGNGWEVAAGGAPVSLCAPTPWAGRFWARTACAESGGEFYCQTGQCLGIDGETFALSCALSGVPPTTMVEPNLVAFGGGAKDFYDVSMVDGFNVPAQIQPTTGSFTADDLYECTIPGATAQTLPSGSRLAACGWDLDATKCPAGLRFVDIPPGVAPVACTTDSDCAVSGQICGVTPRSGTSFACGVYAACASAQDACSFYPTMGDPLSCGKAVSGQGTRDDLYACTGPNGLSCYGNEGTCCGCPEWTAKYDGTQSCTGNNRRWRKLAQPYAEALKDACPTAYSFAYDDATSTFTCLAASATENVGYTITFCPAGSPGAATGAAPAVRSSRGRRP
jgi:hypothetical protein